MFQKVATAVAIAASVVACGQSGSAPAPASTSAPAPGSGDQAFRAIAREAIDDFLHRHPSVATDLGVHDYDRQLENLSAAAFAEESKAVAGFKSRVAAMDPAALSPDAQLDRGILLRVFDATTLGIDVIRHVHEESRHVQRRHHQRAYVIMKRPFAPAAERLASLVARETADAGRLAEARKNLENPPRDLHRDRASNRSTATSASSSTTFRRHSRTSPTRRCWRRVQADQRRRHCRARRLQDLSP